MMLETKNRKGQDDKTCNKPNERKIGADVFHDDAKHVRGGEDYRPSKKGFGKTANHSGRNVAVGVATNLP